MPILDLSPVRLALGLAAALSLAACGGGSDGPDAGPAPLTLEGAIRGGDPAVFTQFAVDTLDRSLETAEPLTLDAVLDAVPPRSETSEPRAL